MDGQDHLVPPPMPRPLPEPTIVPAEAGSGWYAQQAASIPAPVNRPGPFRRYVRRIGWAMIMLAGIDAVIGIMTHEPASELDPQTWQTLLRPATYIANGGIFLIGAIICLHAARHSATEFTPGARMSLRILLAVSILVTVAWLVAGFSRIGSGPLFIAEPVLMGLVVAQLTFRSDYHYQD